MTESHWSRSTAFALLLLVPGLVQAAFYGEPRLYDPTELIVQYRSPAAAVAAKSAQATLGLHLRRSLDSGRTQLLELPAFTRFEQVSALLAADPEVAFVEPNYIRRTRIALPDDPLFGQQWGLRSTGQRNFATDDPALASIPGADMNLPAAWDGDGDGIAERIGSRSVVVAVIDDALDVDHPDLAGNFVAGRNFAGGDVNDPRPDDAGLLSHGTLVAGSLGAVGDNGTGIAGVAWDISMMPLRVGRIRDDEAQLGNDAILAAYEYARDNGAQIVNASYGGPCYSEAEFAAIRALEQAGVLFVTSAGNFNSNLDYSTAAYPANYPLGNVVAVAATNRQDNVASFSQYGPVSTDVAAPGLQIVTTAVGGGYITGDNCGSAGGRCGVNGTSFASPHAAGIAALIKSVHPDADYRELRARLIEGAEDGVDGGDVGMLTAGGRVDAANSLDLTPRPALVIRPTALAVETAPRGPCAKLRPSRVVNLIDNGNQRLDPGETLAVELVIENLWQTATNVQARLLAPEGIVTVLDGPQPLGTLAQNQAAAVRFTIAVGTPASAYRDLPFAVEFSANGGAYRTSRPFRLELAKLALEQRVQATLSEGLHDEFHTYHLDVPTPVPASSRLVFCTAATKDIDVLVKRGRPAQYDIDLGAEQADDPTFFTDADHIGGADDGNEVIEIGNPQPGTYYVTVLNYALADQLAYGLEAFFAPADAAFSGTLCSVTAPGGGGGAFGLASLPCALLALALVLARRR